MTTCTMYCIMYNYYTIIIWSDYLRKVDTDRQRKEIKTLIHTRIKHQIFEFC